jgi:hypothetical protein
MVIVIELWSAILASVNTSQPDSPNRVERPHKLQGLSTGQEVVRSLRLHAGGETVRNLWTDRPIPLDWLLRFRNDVGSELVVSSYAERADDIVKAVRQLRQHGMAVGFPMQTADGEIIFSVGKDFTLTADQILELLGRGELNAEGVRRSVEAQASATRK